MKGANIKMGTSVLRTVIVGMAEFIGNALKLKLKELAEAPFKLFDAKATLVEAEAKRRAVSWLMLSGLRINVVASKICCCMLIQN